MRFPNSRAQTSIEYLVLFVAVLLISSVTAGALYATTDALRIQADKTSQETSENVNNNIEIIHSFGDVEDNEIKQLRLIVKSKRGSGNIDLSESTIVFNADNVRTEVLEISNNANASTNLQTLTASSGEFDIEKKSSEGLDNPLIQSKRERYEIIIPLGDTVTVGTDSDTTDLQDGTDDPYMVDITLFNVEEVKEVSGADIDNFSVINNNLIYEGEERDNVNIKYSYFADSSDSIPRLNEGSSVEVTINLQTGSKTTNYINIPHSLSLDNNKGIKL